MNNRYPAFLTIVAFVILAQPAGAQQATALPSPSPQATATAVPSNNGNTANPGKHLGQIKKIRSGTLTPGQVRFALAHVNQEASKLRGMKSVKFENLRLYRAPASLRNSQHASAGEVAFEATGLQDALAQTTSTNPLLNIFANINVVDALNNTLNSNNVGVTLNDVLNANNVAIGQVLGVYIGGGGIITTII